MNSNSSKKKPFERSLAYRQGFEYVPNVPKFLANIIQKGQLENDVGIASSLESKEERQERLLAMKFGPTESAFDLENNNIHSDIEEREDEKPLIVHMNTNYLNEEELIIESLEKKDNVLNNSKGMDGAVKKKNDGKWNSIKKDYSKVEQEKAPKFLKQKTNTQGQTMRNEQTKYSHETDFKINEDSKVSQNSTKEAIVNENAFRHEFTKRSKKGEPSPESGSSKTIETSKKKNNHPSSRLLSFDSELNG